MKKATGNRCLFDGVFYTTNLYVPTGNLDRKNTEEIISLLKLSNRQYKQTILLVTHDENVALEADRIIKIEDGKIISDKAVRP